MPGVNLDALLKRYPVRESGALNRISDGLGFPHCSKYEGAVLKLLQDDAESMDLLRNLFANLPNELGILEEARA